MRIELPLSTWAEASRGQDDAHTLTLPAQPQLLLQQALAAAAGQQDGAPSRVEVAPQPPRALTLTF